MEILAIKQGRVDYKLMASRIEHLLEAVEDAAIKSVLPDKPDYAYIDELVIRVYGQVVKDYYQQ